MLQEKKKFVKRQYNKIETYHTTIMPHKGDNNPLTSDKGEIRLGKQTLKLIFIVNNCSN